ncbi:hypothetical protein F5888DRAFT_1632241 [Russula emetica]|nr:hypothetical protein F5888DRAFT_1632241 [Russula emetica]
MSERSTPAPPPQTCAATQTALTRETAMTQSENRKNRKKRPYPDTNNGETIDTEMAPPTDPETPQDREKKRKTALAESTPIQPAQTFTSPSLALTGPPEAISTPSFLGRNLHVYLTSPSPQPGTSSPNYGSLCMESFTLSSTDTSATATTTTHAGPTSSLVKRLLAAKEREKKGTPNVMVKDPVEKYTKSDFAQNKIYHSHPTAALDHIDIDQVVKWETFPDGKLLAHPFGHEVRTLANHPDIKTKIFDAVGEITQSSTVGVNALKPFNQELGTPIVFLIYNISDLHREMLLNRQSARTTSSVSRTSPRNPKKKSKQRYRKYGTTTTPPTSWKRSAKQPQRANASPPPQTSRSSSTQCGPEN